MVNESGHAVHYCMMKEESQGMLLMWLDADLQIFHQAYIPRRLEEVDDYEADFERLEAANGGGRAAEGIYYQTLAGMRPDMTGAAAAPAVVEAAARLPGAHARPGSDSGASDGEGFDLDARLGGTAQHSAAAVAEQHVSRATQQSTSAPSEQAGSASDDSSSSDDESDSDEDAEGGDGADDRPKRDPEAEKAARKQHKAEVKEANRERRKHKLKKHVKKRAVNKHKHK